MNRRKSHCSLAPVAGKTNKRMSAPPNFPFSVFLSHNLIVPWLRLLPHLLASYIHRNCGCRPGEIPMSVVGVGELVRYSCLPLVWVSW